ncbi:hypothetical protein [Fictibacillus sp. BK138]|uniref:hypothetical protein n=1 Tax=Fictibacillus sp. BK138 TaxID=2512121 RepID=UPI0010D283DB|nr:hypothetical protein [Fictibacillus sp. BK138]RZT21392.1 hypothetical protein EV282_0454 [Fictibacillus sp. BK138]
MGFLFYTAPIAAIIFVVSGATLAKNIKQDKETVRSTAVCSLSFAYIIFSIIYVSYFTY